jgi:cyclophilin family peptidyl-prolyl cis-trans isomerase
MKYLAIPLALLLVLGCKPQPQKGSKLPQPKAEAKKAPMEALAPEPKKEAALRPEFNQPPPLKKFSGTPYLIISVKDFGTIKVKLEPKSAPQNVSNVYQLAQAGYYDGVVFHRIIKDFMIQTGDPTGTGSGGPPYRIPAEIKLKNARGAIAMARQSDQVNPKKESSGSQFYIILKDQAGLDQAGYTVIGNVAEGMDVVDKIGGVPVQPNPMTREPSSPVTPVIMEKVAAEERTAAAR